MLHIVLLILKIIGIILACLLGLCLLLVLCVLFVPLRYKGAVEKYGEIGAKANLSWLFHLVSFEMQYEGSEVDSGLRILGIKIGRRQKNKRKGKRKAERRKEEQEEPEAYDIDFLEPEEETNRDLGVKSLSGEEKEFHDFTKGEEKRGTEKEQKPKQEKGKWHHRPFEIIRGIRFKIKNICGTLKKTAARIREAAIFLREEETREALRFLKKEAGKVLRHIRPRKIMLKLRFGFENPEYTGKLLGALYAFYGYIYRFQIEPDFENSVFEGEIHFRGRIYGFRLLISFLRIWRNPQIRNRMDRIKQI